MSWRRLGGSTLVVALVLGVLPACSGDDTLVLTLRARDGAGGSSGTLGAAGELSTDINCLHDDEQFIGTGRSAEEVTLPCTGIRYEERAWFSADGRRAVTPARSGDMYFSVPTDGNVECGGELIPRVYVWEMRPAPSPEAEAADRFEVTFDDGDALTIDPDAVRGPRPRADRSGVRRSPAVGAAHRVNWSIARERSR